MAEIDDRGLRIDGKDDSLHARHEPVPVAEISQKRNDGGGMRHENRLRRSKTAELEFFELDVDDFVFDGLDGGLHLDKITDPFSDQRPSDR